MADMSDNNIRLLDTTLILIFLGLMRHRKSTVVANDMGLTQPAISRALKRLRSIYDDALFIRKPHGLEPTSRARALEPGLRQALRTIQDTLAAPGPFDPGTAQIALTIAAFDYELATILPGLISDPALSGGNVRITTLPVSSDEALDGLMNGSIDLALGFVETLEQRGPASPFHADHLYDESYVIVGRQNHPLFDEPIGIEEYAGALHLFIASRAEVRGIVDHALRMRSLDRHVTATVPHFFPALEILSRSSLIATMPLRLAANFARRFGLDHRPLPFDLPRFPVRAVRHIRDSESPVHDWLIVRLRANL